MRRAHCGEEGRLSSGAWAPATRCPRCQAALTQHEGRWGRAEAGTLPDTHHLPGVPRLAREADLSR